MFRKTAQHGCKVYVTQYQDGLPDRLHATFRSIVT
jgi:hypothetical protein